MGAFLDTWKVAKRGTFFFKRIVRQKLKLLLLLTALELKFLLSKYSVLPIISFCRTEIFQLPSLNLVYFLTGLHT